MRMQETNRKACGLSRASSSSVMQEIPQPLAPLCWHACIRHRANDGALWRVKLTLALSTLGRIDHIYVVL